MAYHIKIQSITDISTEEDFRKTKTMSKAILYLVFVAVLASIGHGRVIEKRSPSFYDYYEYKDDNTYNPKMNPIRLNPTQSSGVADLGGQIDKATNTTNTPTTTPKIPTHIWFKHTTFQQSSAKQSKNNKLEEKKWSKL